MGIEQVHKTRIAGIDAARYLLLFCVAYLHTQPDNRTLPVVLTAIACRAAVPFFFMSAGYFFRPMDGPGLDLILKRTRRLLPPFIFWMVVYFLLARIVPGHRWKFRFRDLLTGGAAFHLWFLPALGFGLLIVGVGLRLLGPKLTGAICAVLASWGILGTFYRAILGLISHRLASALAVPLYLNRDMVAPLFILIGTLLARHAVRLAWPWLAGAAVVAYGLLVGEDFMIGRLSGFRFETYEFTFCTFLYAIAVFLLMRSLPASAAVSGAALLGKVSLGVYASHLLFVWLLEERIGNVSLGSSLLIAAIAVISATALSLLMERVPLLRSLVT